MAKARVNLEKCLTYEVRGRTFVKGQPQIIDNDADIQYFKAQPEFTVTMLREVAKPAPKVAPKPVPAPVVDEDGEEELYEEEEPEEEYEAEVPGEIQHTAESLSTMTKLELVTLGQGSRFNLALDGSMKKSELIEAILAQQSLEG